jgi:enoyl-CoA hydratase/carnithine racemase
MSTQRMFNAKEVSAEVAKRHGMLVQVDDPAMLLVTMNEVVLEQCLKRLQEDTQRQLAEFQDAMRLTKLQASQALTKEVSEAGAVLRRELKTDLARASLHATELVEKVRKLQLHGMMWRWIAVGLLCAAGFLLLGLAIGRSLF